MLLSDFFTVALIPALINTTSSVDDGSGGRSNMVPLNSRASANSRPMSLPSSIEEGDLFQDEFFEFGQVQHSNPPSRSIRSRMTHSDPILREIYEEERNLDLAGSGEDFDMRSEEARELIESQRQKLQRERNELARRLATATLPPPPVLPMGRSLPFPGSGTPIQFQSNNERNDPHFERHVVRENPSPTQYPILIPSNTPEVESTQVQARSVGTLGIGGLFGKVKNRVDSSFRKIFGGSGAQTTTSTTASPPQYPPPSSNNLFFPEDDKENTYYPFPEPTPPPYYPDGEPNSIVFGEEPTPAPSPRPQPSPTAPPTISTTREPTSAELNCTQTQTVYQGACYNVLEQLPCPEGQWLIEDENTGRGMCVENKCAHQKNHAFFAGKCIKPRERGDHCHEGMVPYIFKNGDIECDCEELFLFNTKNGNCYKSYTRGPCDEGEIFTIRITQKGTLPAACVKNKCSREGLFCNAPTCPRDRNCVELKSRCENGAGIWDIHPEKLAPACIDLNTWRPDKIIGNVPTLACAPGSRRDILGTCRKPSKISFS